MKKIILALYVCINVGLIIYGKIMNAKTDRDLYKMLHEN